MMSNLLGRENFNNYVISTCDIDLVMDQGDGENGENSSYSNLVPA